MKISIAMCLAIVVFSVAIPVSAQEVAGRIVVAVGDVSITRGDQKIAAASGGEVRAGDVLQLGQQSNAQILFTDQSVVALRQDTIFRVSDYTYQPREPETGRAFFNLVKGGFRTVTGLIGRRNHDNYRVNTIVATIGVRGTHYNLVHCDGNCRNANGSLAPNGTYGSVTDGRISVTNQSGESVFGHDQNFHVASLTSAPQQLIAPPGFLRDKLEGRSRTTSSPVAATGSTQQGLQQGQSSQQGTVAPTGQDGGTGDSRVSSSISTVANPTTNAYQASNNAASSREGLANIIQQSFTGTIFYRASGTFNIPVECTGGACNSIVSGDFTLGVNYVAGQATIAASFKDSGGGIRNYSSPASMGGIPISISGNQITFSSTINRSDYSSNGSFRCSDCGAGGTLGLASQLSFSGTINGTQANVTFSAIEPNGDGTFSVPLSQAALPNNSAAAIVVRNLTSSSNYTRSSAYWNVELDSSGRLISFGPTVGAIQASVSTATNTIVGSAPSAGNLVWGTWGAGSNLTDYNYITGVNPRVVPWITGDAVNNVPPSLGVQTFSMIPGSAVFRNSGDIMNSASLTADFVNRTLNVSLNATSGANTYQMNGTTAFTTSASRFSQQFSEVTCTGPCPGGASNGSFSGFFAGNQAQGAGVSFTGGNGTLGVSGVVGMKR